MNQTKKQIRAKFRNTCFKRDKYKCVMCDFQSSIEKAEQELDCHHITNRNLLPNGGYVKENGASLCKVEKNCHLKAENCEPGYEAETLYNKIKSSHAQALKASEELE